MSHLIRIIIVAYLSAFSSVSIAKESPTATEPTQQQAIYLKHLQYEYRNRELAYLGMGKAAQFSAKSDRASFYQAYFELEQLNRKIYGPMKTTLGVDYRPNWFTRSGLHLLTCLGWRFVSAQQLVNVIVPYIPKLKEMEALSNPRHKPFFYYVIAQEQAQLEASRAALGGDWESGAKVLRNFVEKYRHLDPNTTT